VIRFTMSKRSASAKSIVWSRVLNVYNANSSLPPLSYVPQPAPQPPLPILYPAFPVADQALLETALLQSCDALDGVADGVIDNLPACKAKFDPATATYTSGGATFPLQCTGAKNAMCLSPAQIQAVKNINQGPRNSAGQAIAAPAGAVANDPATDIAQGYVWDGGWMSTVGIPNGMIGGPSTLPGDVNGAPNAFYGTIAGLGYALFPAQPTKLTVEHVHVYSGGQAVVGVVEPPGGGNRAKLENQSHAGQTGYAPQSEMWCPLPDDRPAVPTGSDGERPLPDARGNKPGAPKGNKHALKHGRLKRRGDCPPARGRGAHSRHARFGLRCRGGELS
jgi:hypothetical protein